MTEVAANATAQDGIVLLAARLMRETELRNALHERLVANLEDEVRCYWHLFSEEIIADAAHWLKCEASQEAVLARIAQGISPELLYRVAAIFDMEPEGLFWK